ncbi:MAG: DUF418 domain-containing protein [Gammaproteobacteria bacterium]|nr:DUF418 domain-containing protein [Gammaproteobacteria bacterium]
MTTANQSSRIVLVDALRGFALAGVVLVHMVEQFIAGPAPEGLLDSVNGIPDQVVIGLVQFFLVGKFFALFSILFGLSFSIQMDSAASRGSDFSLRFLWRAALLLLIGYAHHLFYRGDILVIYALLAPFLIPFRAVSTRWLLVVAAFFLLGIPRFIVFAILGNDSLIGLASGMSGPEEVAYLLAIENGSLWDVFRSNAVYGMQTKLEFQAVISGRLYLTFGYFLIGLWLGRVGVFRAPDEFKLRIKKLLLWSIPGWFCVAGLVIATFATSPQPIDFSRWQHLFAINFVDWANLFMTVIIGSSFFLLYHKLRWHKALAFFAPYGRMALTNYVTQSLIGTGLLYAWGLGLLGQFRTMHLAVLALGLIGLQCIASKYWLRAFRYGPLEWAWRNGTYMKVQPFRRSMEQPK